MLSFKTIRIDQIILIISILMPLILKNDTANPLTCFESFKQLSLNSFCERIDKRWKFVLHRDSNYGLFNNYLDGTEVRILEQRNRSFLINHPLTHAYNQGQILPVDGYILCSPYINEELFKGSKFFHLNIHFKGMFDQKLCNSFYKLLSSLKSHKNNIKNPEFEFKKIVHKKFTHYIFDSKLWGMYQETDYRNPNGVVDNLYELEEKIKDLKANHCFSSFLTKTTTLLLDNLTAMGIFKGNGYDLKLYPDLVSFLFPFVMLEKPLLDLDEMGFVIYGYDFREVMNSELSFLFNLEKIKDLLEMGGIFIRTIII